MIKNTLKNSVMSDFITESGNGLSILICSTYNYFNNWMAFSNWYSIRKNLPDAKVAITVGRPSNVDNCYYNWIYKCDDLRYMLHKNVGVISKIPYLNKIYGVYLALKEEIVKQPLVVLESDMMAIKGISEGLLPILNNCKFGTSKCTYDLSFPGKPVGSIWYFNGQSLENIESIINNIDTKSDVNHLDLLSLSRFFGNDIEILEDLGNDVKDQKLATFTHYSSGCGNFTKKDWEKGKTVPPFDITYILNTSDMTVNERKVLNLWSQMGNIWNVINKIKL